MCVSFHLKQEWGGQPFFPGTGALEEIGEYQVGGGTAPVVAAATHVPLKPASRASVLHEGLASCCLRWRQRPLRLPCRAKGTA